MAVKKTDKVITEEKHTVDYDNPKISEIGDITIITYDDELEDNAFEEKEGMYIPAFSNLKATLCGGIFAPLKNKSGINKAAPITLKSSGKIQTHDGEVIIGSDVYIYGTCFGHFSSSRIQCEIKEMVYKNKNGIQQKRKINVRLYDEGKGAYNGIRGKTFDIRNGILAKATLASSLQGAANFVKNLKLGRINESDDEEESFDLSKLQLHGAAAAGIVNSVDKILGMYLMRLDDAHPYIVADAGRNIDVVFEKGFYIK